jgi:hypothetical protein
LSAALVLCLANSRRGVKRSHGGKVLADFDNSGTPEQINQFLGGLLGRVSGRVFSNNTVSGYDYGFLLIGNQTKGWNGNRGKADAPRANTIASNNVIKGSQIACADDYEPGNWSDPLNYWSGTSCGSGGPYYF